MNLVIKGIVVALLGIGIGAGGAYLFHRFQVSYSSEGFFDGQWAPLQSTTKAPAAAKLLVEGINPRNLGEVRVGQQIQTEFLLRNPSENALEFSLAGELPQSITTDLAESQAKILAHSTYPIGVTVSPLEPDPNFSKSLVIQTAAGERTILTVTAQVIPGLQALPAKVTLQRSRLLEPGPELTILLASAERFTIQPVQVEGYGQPPWLRSEITELGEQELQAWPEARSARRLRLTLAESPPVDLQSATLLLATDQAEYAPLRIQLQISD